MSVAVSTKKVLDGLRQMVSWAIPTHNQPSLPGHCACIGLRDGWEQGYNSGNLPHPAYHNVFGGACGSSLSDTHSRGHSVHVFRRPIGSTDGLHSLIILTLLSPDNPMGLADPSLMRGENVQCDGFWPDRKNLLGHKGCVLSPAFLCHTLPSHACLNVAWR
jgi:hypothetical protein